MDARNFFIARDLLYAGGALTGVVLGYVLSFLRGGLSTRSRNRRLTLVLFVFSGALAALSTAIVLSPGEIFAARGLFLLAGLCVPVFALTVLFPRTAAYPLILAGGLLVVWLGYSFLRFPPAAENGPPLLYVYHEGETVYSVRLPAGSGNHGDKADKTNAAPQFVPAGDRAAAVFQIKGRQPPLEIEVVRIGFHPWYPFIGGTERGIVTLIRRGAETFYAAPENSALKTWRSLPDPLGIVFQNTGGTVPLDAIPQGAALAVSFSGETLSFQPSR
jgi:hypothetical protein